MKKLLGILILGLMFCTSSLADNLKNYKYKNYKKNAVKVNFDSIIPKMRAEMFDGKKIDGLLYKPDGNGPFKSVVMLHGAGGIFPYQLEKRICCSVSLIIVNPLSNI